MSHDKPKVSVVIPTYNRKNFVCEAIESVLTQTFTEYELIIIDDGSIDGTTQKLNQYKKFLKYRSQTHKGVSAARNYGIRESKGDFIAFLDSDDLWKKDKLEKQMFYLNSNPEKKICQTDEIWIRNGKWANPRKKHIKPSGFIFEPSIYLCLISPSSVIIHKEIFQKVGIFDETLPACEDYDLWLRITLHYYVYLIDQKLIVKRGGHNDQLSSTICSLDKYRIFALEKILNNKSLSNYLKNKVIEELISKIKIYSNGCFKRGKLDQHEIYNKKLEIYQRDYSSDQYKKFLS